MSRWSTRIAAVSATAPSGKKLIASHRRRNRWVTRIFQRREFPSIRVAASRIGHVYVRQTYSAAKNTVTAAIKPARSGRAMKCAQSPTVTRSELAWRRTTMSSAVRSQLTSERAASAIGVFAARLTTAAGS